jgi:hypothetical protein
VLSTLQIEQELDMADDASTRFPFINLEKALGRAEALFKADPNGKPMVVPTAFEVWGYSPKSSGAFQTVGALKGYGLIEDEGANADRRIKLSSAARHYFLDERDEVRAKAIRDFALTPPLFRALWANDKWSEGIPADTVARSHLKIARKLNDQSSRALLGILKENLQFTGLKAGIVHDEPLESTETNEVDAMPRTEMKAPIAEQSIQAARRDVFSPAPTVDLAAVQLIGDRVVVSANVDLKGLRKLRRQLKMFSDMLSMDDDDDETDPDA